MDSDHVKTYQSMYDQQIALDLGRSGSLGLAEVMVRQLSPEGATQQMQTPAVTGLSAGSAQQATSREREMLLEPQASTGMAQPGRPDDWRPETPEQFVEGLWAHARRAADELGTKPEVLLAQAALETGWGRHMIRGQDGRNSFNLFGIKADAEWQGARALTETVEFRDGMLRRERAPFRAYDTPADSFSDYVAFLKANPRYRAALEQAADAPAYVKALSEAGYATDPDYHGKIERILGSSRLREAVADASRQTGAG
jgi:flagellar protein FlgJ